MNTTDIIMQKKDRREYWKEYYRAHREERKYYDKKRKKAYYQAHKDESNAYRKAHTNSFGKTYNSVRCMSRYYLFTMLKHKKLKGYEIHHCFGYEDYKKFIYIPREIHLQIHQFLRDNNISADSNHYNQIEHIIVNYLKFKERHILVLR